MSHHNSIRPEIWKIDLPIYPPSPVLDISTLHEYARCPRRGLYKYGMRRGFEGKAWPIQYGLAYHKYRETAELMMLQNNSKMTEAIHQAAAFRALEGWEDPPIGHKKEYLDSNRLRKAIIKARERIENEQRTGNVVVTRPEAPFDLPLPFIICRICHFASYYSDEGTNENNPYCTYCGNADPEQLLNPRHGGRVDQFAKFAQLNNADMVRDFKTTGSMGEYYDQKFDPNGQIQGYVWAGTQLAGRPFKGALIETIYNTKTKGPEISQTIVEFSSGQQEQWLASLMIERQLIEFMWSRVNELGYLAFPQRTNACGDFGGCRFRDACRSGSGFELNTWLDNNTIHSEWDFMDPDKEESGV